MRADYLASAERDIQSNPLLQRHGEFCFHSKVFSFDKMHLNMQVAYKEKESSWNPTQKYWEGQCHFKGSISYLPSSVRNTDGVPYISLESTKYRIPQRLALQ